MDSLREVFEFLRGQVSIEETPSGRWWPADSDFEVCVGAILTQNTGWNLVEIAIGELRSVNALTPQAILEMSPGDLSNLIRAAGYRHTKAGYLKNIAAWYLANDAQAGQWSTADLRESLLSVKGVGGETADDIMLYVYDRSVFIYDNYARRMLRAAGLGDYATYDAAKRAVDDLVEEGAFTTEELALFHGLIVEAGKEARRVGGWENLFPELTE